MHSHTVCSMYVCMYDCVYVCNLHKQRCYRCNHVSGVTDTREQRETGKTRR